MLGAEHLCRTDHKHSLLILNGKACWVLGHVYELRPASTHETSHVHTLQCLLSSRASTFQLPRHALLQDEPRALHHFMTALCIALHSLPVCFGLLQPRCSLFGNFLAEAIFRPKQDSHRLAAGRGLLLPTANILGCCHLSLITRVAISVLLSCPA